MQTICVPLIKKWVIVFYSGFSYFQQKLNSINFTMSKYHLSIKLTVITYNQLITVPIGAETKEKIF